MDTNRGENWKREDERVISPEAARQKCTNHDESSSRRTPCVDPFSGIVFESGATDAMASLSTSDRHKRAQPFCLGRETAAAPFTFPAVARPAVPWVHSAWKNIEGLRGTIRNPGFPDGEA